MYGLPATPVRDLEAWLAGHGELFAVIRGHDSGCTSYGFADEHGRWFVKAAYGDEVSQLGSALEFHAAVRHPRIVPLVHTFPLPGGRAVVYPWMDGEILNDPFAPGGLPHEHPRSALNRFRALSAEEILRACDELVEVHEAVVAAGRVAVDFYDGCLLYDFDRSVVHLVDLDLYRPGPYLLRAERQFGSRRFMAPEELRRGATVDQRTTLFTVARAARVLLGEQDAWRGGPALDAVVGRATSVAPEDRYRSFAEFARAWRAARGE
jgi:serine/threonine protein kinase